MRSIGEMLDYEMMLYGIIVLIDHGIGYYQGFQQAQLREAQLETRLAQSQLQALKMQLDPHFLFNTLHTVSELVHEDPEAAERMIVRLSELLRLSLDNAGTQEVVTVDAKQTWSDTGVFVRVGDTITIHADGTIQLSDNPSDVSDPTGARSGRRAPNAPLGSAPAGALIARIGDSSPFLIGANGTINRAPATGRLFLGINDDHFPDNSGVFRATVDIARR